MLKLAVSKYLKSIGDKIFHPNPDYAEWDMVDCLDVIIKKRPRWFWQKNKYIYDHFGINDLLDEPFSVEKLVYLKKPEPLTPNFSYNNKHDVKEEFGANIASLISLDLSADDMINVNIEMDGLMKQSIDFSVVAEELKKKKVNLKNRYLQRLAKDNHNVICIVTQYIYITKPTTIKISIDFNCAGKNTDSTSRKLNVSDSGKFDENEIKTITFDTGTRLAFDFAECLISSDGSIELIDRAEGFHKTHMIPRMSQVDQTDSAAKLHKDFPDSGDVMELSKCLENMNSNNLEITKNLLILSQENKSDIKKLELFLTDCMKDVNHNLDEIDLSLYDLKQMDHPNLLILLEQIGFKNKLPTPIKLKDLKVNIIKEILMKINSIYQLEEEYLQNLLSIINEPCSKKELLMIFLTNLRKSVQDKSMFEQLSQDNKIKKLLTSVGFVGNEWTLNDYFEPTFILLHDI